MHWVVNTCLKRERGYDALIEQLERQQVPYTLCRKPPFADYLVGMDNDIPMMLDIEGPVFVTGTTSMKEVSINHGWNPGYIDSPGIKEGIANWGEMMLNHDSRFGTIADIVPPDGGFFIRPNADSKAFSGTIMNVEEFAEWKQRILDVTGWTNCPPETEVIISPLKTIWAEYRCIMVNGRYVTGSRYKTGKRVEYSPEVGQRIINFANQCAAIWNPRVAFTLDIADTPEGLKIIETNAISSSGFYAIDMNIFVGEITRMKY